MISIIADLKSNAKFSTYSTGDGEDVLTVTFANNTAVTASGMIEFGRLLVQMVAVRSSTTRSAIRLVQQHTYDLLLELRQNRIVQVL